MAKNNAKIIDVKTMLQAGIDPKTRLPLKVVGGEDCYLKEQIKQEIRKNDRQIAINRYKWTGLPKGLTSDLIERVLYYKGQGAFFYMEANDTFYFLPYALDGTIDVYGRYTGITPLPFAGGTTSADGKEKPWIDGLHREPIYEPIIEEVQIDDYLNKCVLIKDYSHGIAQTIIPMCDLQEGIIDTIAECIPYANTALANATGLLGMRVNNPDEQANVQNANHQVKDAALNGKRYIPLVGQVDFQELAAGEVAKVEEFLMAMQAFDNFRVSNYGIDNGGLFQKKAHMLEAEQEMNAGNVGLVLNDGLLLRQWGAICANSVWGTNIWCEASECVVGIDKNMDGEVSEEEDGQSNIDNPYNDGGAEE